MSKFLLAGNKFMSEMDSRQPEFIYSTCTCGPFTKNRERIQNLKKQEVQYIYIYQNKLDKACFQHDMVNECFKDLPRTTASDKVLRHKVFNIARNPKYDRY